MVIYKCTNIINGKIYIGKTKHDINCRIKGHKYGYKRVKYTSKFYNAIKKYGWSNFKWETIEECVDEKELNDREIYWIKNMNSISEGYNINTGGDGGDNYKNHPFMDEIRKRISEGVKNSNRWTPKRKKIQSDIMKLNPPMYNEEYKKKFMLNKPTDNKEFRDWLIKKMKENNPMHDEGIRQKHLVICQSEKHRIKMSKLSKGIKRGPFSKEHRLNISKARKGKKLSEEHKKNISETLKGRANTWGDKIGDALRGKNKSNKHREKLAIAKSKDWWIQLDKNTNTIINIFNSGKEIEKILNFSCNNLVDKDKFPNRNPYGFKWKRYKKNEISKEEIYTLYR